MSDFRKHLADSMEDPKFAAEWDAQATESEIMRKVLNQIGRTSCRERV